MFAMLPVLPLFADYAAAYEWADGGLELCG